MAGCRGRRFGRSGTGGISTKRECCRSRGAAIRFSSSTKFEVGPSARAGRGRTRGLIRPRRSVPQPAPSAGSDHRPTIATPTTRQSACQACVPIRPSKPLLRRFLLSRRELHRARSGLPAYSSAVASGVVVSAPVQIIPETAVVGWGWLAAIWSCQALWRSTLVTRDPHSVHSLPLGLVSSACLIVVSAWWVGSPRGLEVVHGSYEAGF